MPVPLLDPMPAEDAPPEARARFEAFLKERGNVPNMFRTMARRPEIMATLADHLRAVTYSGTVPPRLKESLAVYVSLRHRCPY